MEEAQGYVLGQSARAARSLEIQDAHFAEPSERTIRYSSLNGSSLSPLACAHYSSTISRSSGCTRVISVRRVEARKFAGG